MQQTSPQSTPWVHLIAAALILTVSNAIKPAHIDDNAYLYYANEFLSHPTNPYDFVLGSPSYINANDLLVPPVLPYWLGMGITVLGKHPFLLKLWLFPFSLALACGVDFLAARLAPGHRKTLLWLVLISPTLLTGYNLMLDVPMLAMGLAAMAIAIRSVERDSWGLTLLSGLLFGLSIQTKYTGIVLCGASVAWCVLKARYARGAVILAMALALVVGWECFVAMAQGESHFLVHLRQRQGSPVQRCVRLLMPLISHLAGLTPVVTLLALKALGWTNRAVLAIGLGMLVAVGVLAAFPSQAALIAWTDGKNLLTSSNIVYGLLALPAWAALIAVCARLARSPLQAGQDRTLDLFLLAWMLMELAGYFALSPFPAARRLNGLVVVFTLITGRLAALSGMAPRTGGYFAIGGIAVASLFFFTDLLDARAAQHAARVVARGHYDRDDKCVVWHLSWWGFNYYADEEGMRPLQLNRVLPQEGDLVVLHDLVELRATIDRIKEINLAPIDTIVISDHFPFSVTPGYYSGRTPLESRRDGRIRVQVFRVTGVSPEKVPAHEGPSDLHRAG